jgi:Rrf2 family protein
MPMKLSRAVAYAIQAMWQLAESHSREPVACHELAEAGHMPPRFLLQVLGDLAKSNLLHSIRGSVGGYSLERSMDDISLLEVIEAVGCTVELQLPAQRFAVPAHEPLKEVIKGVNNRLRQELAAIKIAHLIPQPVSHSQTPV